MSTASRETIIIVYEKLLRIISLPLPPDCSTVFLKSFSQLCNHFWQFMFFWIIMFFNDSFSSFSAMYFLFFLTIWHLLYFFRFLFVCLTSLFVHFGSHLFFCFEPLTFFTHFFVFRIILSLVRAFFRLRFIIYSFVHPFTRISNHVFLFQIIIRFFDNEFFFQLFWILSSYAAFCVEKLL